MSWVLLAQEGASGLLRKVEQPRILPWVAATADGLRPNDQLSSRGRCNDVVSREK